MAQIQPRRSEASDNRQLIKAVVTKNKLGVHNPFPEQKDKGKSCWVAERVDINRFPDIAPKKFFRKDTAKTFSDPTGEFQFDVEDLLHSKLRELHRNGKSKHIAYCPLSVFGTLGPKDVPGSRRWFLSKLKPAEVAKWELTTTSSDEIQSLMNNRIIPGYTSTLIFPGCILSKPGTPPKNPKDWHSVVYIVLLDEEEGASQLIYYNPHSCKTNAGALSAIGKNDVIRCQTNDVARAFGCQTGKYNFAGMY